MATKQPARGASSTTEARRRSLFSISFTARNVIDEQSPLHGETPESLKKMALEIMCILSGVDETSVQSLHARALYVADDLRYGERFEDIIRVGPDGTRVIDYRRFHDTKPAPLSAH